MTEAGFKAARVQIAATLAAATMRDREMASAASIVGAADELAQKLWHTEEEAVLAILAESEAAVRIAKLNGEHVEEPEPVEQAATRDIEREALLARASTAESHALNLERRLAVLRDAALAVIEDSNIRFGPSHPSAVIARLIGAL